MQKTDSAGKFQGVRSLFYSLRRHTSSGLYIAELDGLRFVAIAAVYLFHVAGDILRHSAQNNLPSSDSFLYSLLNQLNIGVPLFFAISGMILGLPFARYWLQGGPRISLRRYLLRRLTRLEPPYVLALLGIFALECVSRRGTIERLPHLGASLLYLHSLVYGDISTINPVTWSLEVEVQFYLLAPLLAMVYAIRSAPVRRTLMAGVIVAATIRFPWSDLGISRDRFFANHHSLWIAHLSLAGNIQYFLTGFLLAEIFLLAPMKEHRSRKWDLVSAIGWPALAILLVRSPQLVFASLPLFILPLYAAAFYGPISSRVFGDIRIASIGGMCYSIYLLHNYTIAALGFLTERAGQTLPFEIRLLIQLVLITPCVLGLSIVFYLVIEQPCMRSDWPVRLRSFLRSKTGHGAETTAVSS